MARQNGRSAAGYVDGTWRPRSDDLSTEFADLLAVLSVRLGANRSGDVNPG
jgi:hypothetical protein